MNKCQLFFLLRLNEQDKVFWFFITLFFVEFTLAFWQDTNYLLLWFFIKVCGKCKIMFNVKRTTNNVQVSFLFGIFVFIGHWKLSIWHCSLKQLQYYLCYKHIRYNFITHSFWQRTEKIVSTIWNWEYNKRWKELNRK